MPDVEVTCGACKGARFNSETLDVTVRCKTIDDVLNMSVEEGVKFFAGEPVVGKKIQVRLACLPGQSAPPPGRPVCAGTDSWRLPGNPSVSSISQRTHRWSPRFASAFAGPHWA